MKRTRLIPALLLLLTAACSEESTLPQPTRHEKLVSKILITQENAPDSLCMFYYDEGQNLRQVINSSTRNGSVIINTYTLDYQPGQIVVNLRMEGHGSYKQAPYTVTLTPAGFAEIVSSMSPGPIQSRPSGMEYDQPMVTTIHAHMYYNSMGYYYEKPSNPESDRYWSKIEYLLSGETCNLIHSASYWGLGEPEERPIASYTLDYGTQLNDKANLDLSYFALRHLGMQSCNRIPLLFWNLAGKRCHNLPVKLTTELFSWPKTEIEYAYQIDAEGYITRITEQSAGSLVVYNITYTK